MIYIASDHAGFELKKFIIEQLSSKKIAIINLGTDAPISVDYPDYAKLLTLKIHQRPNAQGILICGTGIGMSMAANRNKHIRAALCVNNFMAIQARRHNDANVLVLGSFITKPEDSTSIIDDFLHTEFEHDRHIGRIKKFS